MKPTKHSFNYWQWRVIICSMIGYSMFYFVRKNFSFAMPALGAEYGINDMSFGIILTLVGIIYGVSKFLNGIISDRTNARWHLAIGLAVCVVLNLIFGWSADISHWVTGQDNGPDFVNAMVVIMAVLLVVNNIFQGCGFGPCNHLMVNWVPPKELATKMSIWNTSHSIGSFIAVVICGLIMTNMGADMSGNSSIVAQITGNLANSIKGWDDLPLAEQASRIMSYAAHYGAWRWCFLIPAMVAVGGAILCFFTLKDNPQSVGLPEIAETHTGKEATDGKKGAHKAFLDHMVFKNKWVWMFAMANIFVYVLRMGVLDWGPKFLTESRGMNINSAAWSVAAFELTAIVGTIFAGWATDHIFKGKAHRMCVFAMVGAVIFLGLFALVDMPVVLSTLVLAMAGFCIYGPQALIGIGSANQATKEASATANGLVGVFGYVGSALSALGVGLIADHWGWDAVFITFICAGCVGVIVFLFMWKAPRDGYERSRQFTEKFVEEYKQ